MCAGPEPDLGKVDAVDLQLRCSVCDRKLSVAPADVLIEGDGEGEDDGRLWFACTGGHVASTSVPADEVDRLVVAGARPAPSPADHERRRLRLAAELRKLRRKQDKTGTELAELARQVLIELTEKDDAQLNQSKISRIETGRYIPSAKELAAITKALHADHETQDRLAEAAATLQAEATALRRLQQTRTAPAMAHKLELCTPTSPWLGRLRAHPAVENLRSGTPTSPQFGPFVAQDWLFLSNLAKVYWWLLTKVPRSLPQRLRDKHEAHWKEALEYCINSIASGGVLADIASQLEVPIGPNVEMAATCREYSTYLLGLVSEEAPADYACVVASTLPCAWGYWELGQTLAEAHDAPYMKLWSDWVKQDKTGSFYRTQQDLLNDAVAATGVSQQVIRRVFDEASSFELRFWDVLLADDVVTRG